MERRHNQGEQHTSQDAALLRLEQAVRAIHHTESFRRWLDISPCFHIYSLGNQVLIAFQRPDATYVAGSHAWLKMGRHLRRGETGIRIMVPHVGKVTNDEGQEERRVFGFGTAVVFDVTQTDGEPLPEHVVPRLEGEGGAALWEGLQRFAATEGVSVTIAEPEQVPADLMGYYESRAKAIVAAAHSQSQKTKTFAHELRHHIARIDDRAATECIAEGIAYVVCAHFGLDTGGRSFPYLAGWARELEVLKGVLGTIQSASTTIINGVEASGTARKAPTAYE